jgi:branched-chain amino acid transport system ATP-binding protein
MLLGFVRGSPEQKDFVLFLDVVNLTKSFGGLTAVNGLDISVHEGEILGLIGPNGSGKTTLFSLITGFLKPDSGGVFFQGKEITGLKPHVICECGVVRTFQAVRPFSKMTAVENVMVGKIYGRDPAPGLREALEESKEILTYVGLGKKWETAAGKLTLSDRKRLEVARALAAKPHLLLLDEVMAGLNPTEADEAVKLVRNIRDSGVTVVMVEHNIKVVMKISSRITVISSGEKIFDGPPREARKDQRVISSYLGGD